MNLSNRHTPARALGKVVNIKGIECVSLKGADILLKAKPGIYMIIGKSSEGLFCYIGLATNLGPRSISHIYCGADRAVNKRLSDYIRNHAPDKERRNECMTTLCIETHDYTGMDETQRRHYQRDREVIHWKRAMSIFGDDRMLNERKPQLAPSNARGVPIRQVLPNGGIIDWPSANQFCKATTISDKTLKNALENNNGKLFEFRVKIIRAVKYPYNPKKHKPEDYQPSGPRDNGVKCVRQHLPNGNVIDWESARQFAEMTTISHRTLKNALDNRNGKLFRFRVETIPAVEHPYDPKKHSPKDYQPAPGPRGIPPTKAIRQHLPDGTIIDWPTSTVFRKTTKISDKKLQDSLKNRNGEMYKFRVEIIPAVEYPYDPKKHKPADYQPAFGQKGNEAKPIRQRLPNGGVIDWATSGQFRKMVKVHDRMLKDALENRNGKLYEFHVEIIHAIEHPYDPKRHKPQDYQPSRDQRRVGAIPVRQHLPNGGVIDWATSGQFCEMTKISWKTLDDALRNKAGALYGFHVEKIPAIEHPYDPKKHGSQDYQPARDHRRVGAIPVRQHLPNGSVIDWESVVQFCKILLRQLNIVIRDARKDA